MKNVMIAATAALVIGLSSGTIAVAHQNGHSEAADNSPHQEMMQGMMQKMRHCMMQMMEEHEGMDMNSSPDSENNSSSSGNMSEEMMSNMMDKMKTCMMQMDAEEGDSESHDHQH
jgi:hypothetical protein